VVNVVLLAVNVKVLLIELTPRVIVVVLTCLTVLVCWYTLLVLCSCLSDQVMIESVHLHVGGAQGELGLKVGNLIFLTRQTKATILGKCTKMDILLLDERDGSACPIHETLYMENYVLLYPLQVALNTHSTLHFTTQFTNTRIHQYTTTHNTHGGQGGGGSNVWTSQCHPEPSQKNGLGLTSPPQGKNGNVRWKRQLQNVTP
jgi:hypothetical protein